MSSNMTGSFQLMKSLNRSLILNKIRIHGMISRSEIAKKTKLTPPTVTNLVNELIEAKLVVESQPGISKGGRKPILLTINADSRYIIGVDVGIRKVRIALSNLNGELLVRKMESMPHIIDKEEFLSFLQRTIASFLEDVGDAKEKLIGIGVAMHGIVDHQTGTAVYAPNLKLVNVPVKAFLEEKFQLNVRVENDAKALALGEKWFGIGKEVEHFICLNVGEGIGAGVMFDDALLHGNDSLAGEIGHTTIDINGPTCSCGNRGCFQTLASGQALKKRAKKVVQSGRGTILSRKVNGNLELLDGKLIYECALKGDEVSKEVLYETGKYLGVGILNMIHFINPQMIIIGGGVSKAEKFLMAAINQVVQSMALSESAKNTSIVISKLGEEGSLIGSCTLVLSELFSHETAAE